MQIDKSNIEILTEQFMNHEFSATEKKQFETTLANDAELRTLFEIHKDAILTVELAAIRQELNDSYIKEETVHPTKKLKSIYFKYMLIAASLIIVLGLGGFYILQKSADDRRYARFLYKDEGLPITMGITDNREYTAAMNAYKSGDYELAKKKFGDLLVSAPQNDTAQYYLAMILINQNDMHEATTVLQKIITKPESAFNSNAKYFMALIYIKQHEIEKAKQLLNQVNSSKADELLRDLE